MLNRRLNVALCFFTCRGGGARGGRRHGRPFRWWRRRLLKKKWSFEWGRGSCAHTHSVLNLDGVRGSSEEDAGMQGKSHPLYLLPAFASNFFSQFVSFYHSFYYYIRFDYLRHDLIARSPFASNTFQNPPKHLHLPLYHPEPPHYRTLTLFLNFHPTGFWGFGVLGFWVACSDLDGDLSVWRFLFRLR